MLNFLGLWRVKLFIIRICICKIYKKYHKRNRNNIPLGKLRIRRQKNIEKGFSNFKFGFGFLTSAEKRHCVIDKLQQSKVQIAKKYIKNNSSFFGFICIFPSLRWYDKILTEYFELSSINIFIEIIDCLCRYVFKITKRFDIL